VLEHGLEYLKSCYIKDPSEYGNQYGDVYVYQVGDVQLERTLWRRPEDIMVCIHAPKPPPCCTRVPAWFCARTEVALTAACAVWCL
jgi:hypothetical protein